MFVTKIEEAYMPPRQQNSFTQEQLQQEYQHALAQCILKKMLNAGLISTQEFKEITNLNRKTFQPFLADIMPVNR